MSVLPAVMVFAGPRDRYQTALALQERGLLDCLVTEAYFGPGLAHTGLLGHAFHRFASARHHPAIPSSGVRTSWSAFCSAAIARIAGAKNTPWLARSDRALSEKAGRLALRTQSPLVAYSYYAGPAFRILEKSGLPCILFQVHPHGGLLRRLYREEIDRVPQARASLMEEAEMAADFAPNDDALALATGVICTSQFTRRSLLEAGCKVPIEVIPYGVDPGVFTPRTRAPKSGPLKVAFVGALSQRKGASHLLKALASFPAGMVSLIVYSRAPVSRELLAGAGTVDVQYRRGLSDDALAEDLGRCDLLVLPSIAEGFGLVILEAMACGVPVLCTDATGGADFITHGKDGYVVPAGDPDALRSVMQAALEDPTGLLAVGQAARRKAEGMGWDSYRRNIAAAYQRLIA